MQLTQASVAQYADQMIRQVEGNGGPPLEFTEDSLRLLDLLFRRNDSDFVGLTEGQKQITVFYNGCFLGCALAALLGGTWVFEGEWPDSAVLIPLPDGSSVQLRPFEKVWRRLDEGEAGNSFLSYFEEIDALTRPAATADATIA
jgi:hypothetical protein